MANIIAQDKFIAEYYLNGGRKKAAAESSGCGWSTVKSWFADDEEFKKRVEEYREVWREDLRATARQRAVEKSDVLLMFLMKADQPEVYDDNVRKAIYLAKIGVPDPDTQKPVQIIMQREPMPGAPLMIVESSTAEH